MEVQKQYISLKDMLRHIETGALFAVEVVAFDKKRTLNNGRILVYSCCRLEAAMGKEEITNYELRIRKNRHFTRNLRLYANGRPTSAIRKIHPLLVTKVDGKEVVL